MIVQLTKGFKRFLARRFGSWRSRRITNQDCFHYSGRGSDCCGFDRLSGERVHKPYGIPQRHSKFRILKLVNNERGEGELIAALIVVIVLVFLLIQPIDTHVMQNKYIASKMILNKYMNKMRLEGYLTSSDETDMVQDFDNIGCPITDITANAKESRGDARVLRNSDPNTSALSLTLTCTPTPQPFKMMNLIGGSQTPTQISVGRKDQSEKVSP
ncbi:MAG: hypothetical protein A4E56_00416 [Pelotomaculum sp. PtaU1.Bin065]|nr:MAG: hypothetical protein A4E56_00416 [Pelotomaculum sp. PtaU1.Bin065]